MPGACFRSVPCDDLGSGNGRSNSDAVTTNSIRPATITRTVRARRETDHN